MVQRTPDEPPIELVFTTDEKKQAEAKRRLQEFNDGDCKKPRPISGSSPLHPTPQSWEENQAEPDDTCRNLEKLNEQIYGDDEAQRREAQRRLQESNDKKWGAGEMSILRAVAGDPEEQKKWEDYSGRLTTEAGSEERRFEVGVLATCDRLARLLIHGFKGSGGTHPMSETLDIMLGNDPDDSPGNVLDKSIEALICQRMNLDRVTTVGPKCSQCGFSPNICQCTEVT